MKWNQRLKCTLQLLLLLMLPGLPLPSSACLQHPNNPPEVWIHGDPCRDEVIIFVIHDYTTFAADPTKYCSCALNMPLFLGTVLSAQIVKAGTMDPLPGFSFSFNPDTGDAYRALSSTGNRWTGFESGLTQVVATGQAVDLVFRVKPNLDEIECGSWNQYVADNVLTNQDAIGTGGSDAAGTPTDHITILPAGTVGFAPAIASCAPPPAGLVGWWPLDELFGTTAADIAGGNLGTHVNGPVPSAGKVAGALQFDGQNDYVEVPDQPSLDFGTGDFSVDLWVRTTSNNLITLLDKRSDSGGVRGFSFHLQNGIPGFQLADQGGPSNTCSGNNTTSACTNFGAQTSISDGNWHFLAVTVDRQALGSFYVDGVLDATFDATIRPGSLSNDHPLRLGTRAFQLAAFFDGDMDEVELSNRVLDATEIQSIYLAGASGKCKPPKTGHRLINHITVAGGAFTTEILITNNSAQSQSYQLYPFESNGNPLAPISGAIAANTTERHGIAGLFGTTAASHFYIEGSAEANFVAEYEVTGGGNPTHIGETNVQAPDWRLFPGDWSLVFDGMAIVNTSAHPATIEIQQRDFNDTVLATHVVGTLAPSAKALVVLNDFFVEQPNTLFEVVADQPLSVLALRFIKPDLTIFWLNPALAFP